MSRVQGMKGSGPWGMHDADGDGPSPGAIAFVYRPGGVAGGNVYTDLLLLMADRALVEGPAIIEVDDSIVTPAPAPAAVYDFTDTEVIGNRSRPTSLTALSFADGATITTFPPRSEAINYLTESTSPVFTTAGGVVVRLDDATLTRGPGSTAAFIRVTGGTLNLFLQGGGLGGALPVVDLDAAGTVNLAIDWSGLILQDTVSGTGTAVVIIRSPANFLFNTFSGPVFTGTLSTILQSKSAEQQFAETGAFFLAPPPTNVSDALNRVAAAVFGLVGPIP